MNNKIKKAEAKLLSRSLPKVEAKMKFTVKRPPMIKPKNIRAK